MGGGTAGRVLDPLNVFDGFFGKKPHHKLPDSPIAPDLTDQAVRMRNQALDQSTLFGARRASMLTGPLGNRSSVPDMQKSILGEI